MDASTVKRVALAGEVVTLRRIEFLASYLAKKGQVPQEVVAHARRCILDQIGVTVGGVLAPTSLWVRGAAITLFGDGPCTVVGDGKPRSVGAAMFANAVSGSALDMDEGHNMAVGHPSAAVFAPALAAAEVADVSGQDFLEGYIKGYEVAARVALARTKPSTYATGPWGAYGAAAAVAVILRLDEFQCLQALAIAGSHAPIRPPLSDYRRIPSIKEAIGWGALTGGAAAFLAAEGLTGVLSVLEGHDYDDGVLRGLGEEYLIVDNYFKLHAACRWTHAALDAALRIKREFLEPLGIQPNDIDLVTVRTFEKAVRLDSARPRTLEEAQYSLPWLVAVALTVGEVDPCGLLAARRTSGQIDRLAERVRLEVDPVADAQFPRRRRAAVKVAVGGRQFTSEVAEPKGSPSNPVTDEELLLKFRSLASRALEECAVEEVLRMVWEIEALPKMKQLTVVIREGIKSESRTAWPTE